MVATLLVGLGFTEGGAAARGDEVDATAAAAAATTATTASVAMLPLGVLVGGGLLVLAGTILEGVLPWTSLVITALGCGASIPAALWTVFVPLLLVVFFVVRAWQLPVVQAAMARTSARQPEPAGAA
jgi:hypothetical protein